RCPLRTHPSPARRGAPARPLGATGLQAGPEARMASEAITLKSRDGDTVEGTAEVVRFGEASRMARAGALAFGGLVLGIASIVVPVLHFVSTWLLPLVGVLAAVHVYRTPLRISRVETSCPSCGQ